MRRTEPIHADPTSRAGPGDSGPPIDRRTALAHCLALAAATCVLDGSYASPSRTILVNGWVLLPDDLKSVPAHAL